jgi:hypothetical protein
LILKSKSHITTKAWATPANGRIQIAIGAIRLTATPEEAAELAEQLDAAVDEILGSAS